MRGHFATFLGCISEIILKIDQYFDEVITKIVVYFLNHDVAYILRCRPILLQTANLLQQVSDNESLVELRKNVGKIKHRKVLRKKGILHVLVCLQVRLEMSLPTEMPVDTSLSDIW